MNTLLFVVIPYLAAAFAIGGSIYRYSVDRFSVSSRSSQLLENRALFWGSVPWHYGIVIILGVHIIAGLIPGGWDRLMGAPWRVYLFELVGMALAAGALVGLLILTGRRLGVGRIRSTSRALDWLVLAVLLVQVGLGLYTAFAVRWGGTWYPQTAVPWLRSLVTFRPDPGTIVNLPVLVRAHFLVAFLFIALLPFTRLIHIFTFPLGYLWRPWQVLIRYRRIT